jgi:hypothetical protein
MEPDYSLPHSQELSTCPYSGPDHSVHSSLLPLQDPSSPSYVLVFLWASFFLVFLPISGHRLPILPNCPAHFILYDLIIIIILGEEYKSRSTLLFGFLHPLVTSSLFGPNILPSTLFSSPLSPCSSLKRAADTVNSDSCKVFIQLLLQDVRFVQ